MDTSICDMMANGEEVPCEPRVETCFDLVDCAASPDEPSCAAVPDSCDPEDPACVSLTSCDPEDTMCLFGCEPDDDECL